MKNRQIFQMSFHDFTIMKFGSVRGIKGFFPPNPPFSKSNGRVEPTIYLLRKAQPTTFRLRRAIFSLSGTATLPLRSSDCPYFWGHTL